MKTTILLLLAMLTSCSTITDFLLKDENGVHVDAQVGQNDNKVKTGVGALGLNQDTRLTVADSENVSVKTDDNKYKISTATGDTQINVYETNYWLYAIFALFILGKPALRSFWAYRRKLNLYKYIDSLSTPSNPSVDRTHSNEGRSSKSNTHKPAV